MNYLLGPVRLTTAVLCLVISVIAAAAAYGIGHELTATYAASGTIRVVVSAQGGVSDTNVLAENDLATQYAQLVNSPSVEQLAAKRLGVAVSNLSGTLSGSTVAAQNLLQVTATGATPLKAESTARAGVQAIDLYLTHANQQQVTGYFARIQQGVKRSITLPYRDVTPKAVHPLAANLAVTRATVLGEGVRDAAANLPTLQIVDPGGSASETAPKPKLYALVAFVVALIVTVRVAFMVSQPTEA